MKLTEIYMVGILTNCITTRGVLHVIEPNLTQVPGETTEYTISILSTRNSKNDTLLFEFVCTGPVLMKWNLSRHMVSSILRISLMLPKLFTELVLVFIR